MVLQSVARLFYQLPVSLLEVNTIGHAICALLIYVLWWSKPRLINEPTILRGDWVPSVSIYLLLSSGRYDGRKMSWWTWGRAPDQPELIELSSSLDESLGTYGIERNVSEIAPISVPWTDDHSVLRIYNVSHKKPPVTANADATPEERVSADKLPGLDR